MKRVAATIIACLFSANAFSGCFVQDGTFYAKGKSQMTAFAMYMDQKNPRAFDMVDDGRIKSCTRASAVVIKRDNKIVNVNISGIGKVWVYETFLHCR